MTRRAGRASVTCYPPAASGRVSGREPPRPPDSEAWSRGSDPGPLAAHMPCGVGHAAPPPSASFSPGRAGQHPPRSPRPGAQWTMPTSELVLIHLPDGCGGAEACPHAAPPGRRQGRRADHPLSPQSRGLQQAGQLRRGGAGLRARHLHRPGLQQSLRPDGVSGPRPRRPAALVQHVLPLGIAGRVSHPGANSATPAGHPAIWSDPETRFPGWAQTPEVQGSAPQARPAPTSDTSHKPGSAPVLLTTQP